MNACINREGIANILCIPILYKYGYYVTCDTKEELILYTPEGKSINFLRNYGYCEVITYVHLSTTEYGVMIVNTIKIV